MRGVLRVGLGVVVLLGLTGCAGDFRYNWQWSILACTSENVDAGCIGPYFYWILQGLGWTIAVASAAWVIAFSLGSVIGILRTLDKSILVVVPFVKSPIYFKTRWIGTSKGIITVDVGWFLHGFANVYVTIFRNVPLLVQLFLWYFVFPELLSDEAGMWVKRGLWLPEFWTAVVCMGLYTASRVAEQVRAGINSISQGQQYAAMAIGLTPVQVYRYVLLPVSFRIIIPPLTSDFLGVFKNSSLALTIGVLELTAMTRQIEEYSYAGFEAFTAATVCYIGVTAIVMWAMRIVEARIRIPGMISLEAK
ncbi:MAG: amino acid ABC transporter permease [Proteobacteria bacterium]|nr:MAG: amino acid ABC transporter permease [Pseudomonadota bacterium]